MYLTSADALKSISELHLSLFGVPINIRGQRVQLCSLPGPQNPVLSNNTTTSINNSNNKTQFVQSQLWILAQKEPLPSQKTFLSLRFRV